MPAIFSTIFSYRSLFRYGIQVTTYAYHCSQISAVSDEPKAQLYHSYITPIGGLSHFSLVKTNGTKGVYGRASTELMDRFHRRLRKLHDVYPRRSSYRLGQYRLSSSRLSTRDMSFMTYANTYSRIVTDDTWAMLSLASRRPMRE